MAARTISEELFVQFCAANRIPWELVPTGTERTPDFRIRLGDTQVTCEVKQIDPNAEDVAELEELGSGEAVGRLVPNRMRDKLKDSAQLKAASHDGRPTLFVVYDKTPIKMYTFHSDVAQAMFGRDSVRVSVFGGRDGRVGAILWREPRAYPKPEHLCERSCNS
jgi:hypothetical protein